MRMQILPRPSMHIQKLFAILQNRIAKILNRRLELETGRQCHWMMNILGLHLLLDMVVIPRIFVAQQQRSLDHQNQAFQPPWPHGGQTIKAYKNRLQELFVPQNCYQKKYLVAVRLATKLTERYTWKNWSISKNKLRATWWHGRPLAGQAPSVFCMRFFGKHNFKINLANYRRPLGTRKQIQPQNCRSPIWKIQQEGYQLKLQKYRRLQFQNCRPGPRTEAVPIKAAKI